MVDFSKVPCIYWNDITKMSHLQRRIIIYSIMYYEMDESCVDDFEYDSISKQLVELQKKSSFESFRKTTYFYAMHDFDGSTGFDIPSRLTSYDKVYLTNLAKHIYNQWKRKRRN